jgi:hypothetical protein
MFNNFQNQRGQILVESIFMSLVIAGILFLFSQLLDFQKNNQKLYYFSKNKKAASESNHP